MDGMNANFSFNFSISKDLLALESWLRDFPLIDGLSLDSESLIGSLSPLIEGVASVSFETIFALCPL